MLSPRIGEGQQIPLIHEPHSDDNYLLNTLDGEWFEILYYLVSRNLSPYSLSKAAPSRS